MKGRFCIVDVTIEGKNRLAANRHQLEETLGIRVPLIREWCCDPSKRKLGPVSTSVVDKCIAA